MLVPFVVPSAESICEVFDMYFYSVTDAQNFNWMYKKFPILSEQFSALFLLLQLSEIMYQPRDQEGVTLKIQCLRRQKDLTVLQVIQKLLMCLNPYSHHITKPRNRIKHTGLHIIPSIINMFICVFLWCSKYGLPHSCLSFLTRQ